MIAGPLSLHHLTVREVNCAALIQIARMLGCDQVCLFVDSPAVVRELLPCILTDIEASRLAERLNGAGLTVCSLDFFVIDPMFDPAAHRAALERGAILGGRRATVQVKDADLTRAVDRFVALAAIAAEYGISLSLEFTGMATIASMEAAALFLARANVARAALAADPLHLFRCGGDVSDVRHHAAQIGYAQICDGRGRRIEGDYRQEALFNRMVPGTGDFPLVDFVAALPPGIPVSVEAPFVAADLATTALDRARAAVQGARAVLAAAAEADGHSI